MQMKITIISDGPFGDRAYDNIKVKFPDTSLFYIDEVDRGVILDEYDFDSEVETAIKGSDLLISYIRHPDIILELCYFEKPTIIAIYRGSGLLNQVRDINSATIMPSSMCSIEPNTGIPIIDEFSEEFGKPVYEIDFDKESNTIKRIKLKRESPCGATKRSLTFLENQIISPKKIDEFAMYVIHECRESVSYRLSQEETASAAAFNHIFPFLQDIKKIKPVLFEKNGSLFGYEKDKLDAVNKQML